MIIAIFVLMMTSLRKIAELVLILIYVMMASGHAVKAKLIKSYHMKTNSLVVATTNMDGGYSMDEIVVVSENRKDFQKKMNQWRHQFEIKIHKIHFDVQGDYVTVHAVIERSPK